jgi:hypothetical protein
MFYVYFLWTLQRHRASYISVKFPFDLYGIFADLYGTFWYIYFKINNYYDILFHSPGLLILQMLSSEWMTNKLIKTRL